MSAQKGKSAAKAAEEDDREEGVVLKSTGKSKCNEKEFSDLIVTF